MSTSSRLLVMKPSTSAAVTGSASVSSSTGQLISKCLFGVFTFFHKTNENMSTSSKVVFVRSFFGRNVGLKSFWICLIFTGTRPKKRSQSRRREKTIILDSDDTNSPSTSQTAAALSVSENRKSGPKSLSRRKSSIRSNSGYHNNMRQSSQSASTSTGGSPKKRVKKKGKSLKQKLRETVLDESADWRQRFRQTEEKNRKLEEKLIIKKQEYKSKQDQNRREIKVK